LGRFAAQKRLNSQVASVTILGLVLTTLLVMSPTSEASSNSFDTSNAVRYNADGSPIGEVVYEFIDKDDATKKIVAPFPINFFGERLPALCLSTNGLVYPIASVSSDCTPRYDRSVEFLALNSTASAIAPLALDLEFGREASQRLNNPHLRSVNELSLTQVVAHNNVGTYTTDAPHGFRVGDRVHRHFVNNFFSDGLNTPNDFVVISVPSPTTFTGPVNNGVLDGTYTNAVGKRAVVWREPIRTQVNEISISGTTLTVKTSLFSSDTNIGPGRTLTLTGTGIPALEGKRLTVATTPSHDVFTATVSGIEDLDPNTVGNQNSISFSVPKPYALELDAAGAVQQVYFGTTVVDGRDAYAVTWYRAEANDSDRNGPSGFSSDFPAVNPRNLSITAQLIILKRNTGSDSAGWDFDYEFNIGYADDPSDGYKASDPNFSCNVFSDMRQGNCRWAMGTARYFPGPEVSFVEFDGSVVTLTTATPHGMTVGRGVSATGLNSLLNESNLEYRGAIVSEVVDAYTLKFPTGYTGTPVSRTDVRTFDPPARLGYAEGYELFPDYSSLQLVDAGGSTALVRNSLNSSVLGRYTFGMSGGNVTGFLTPTMGNGISGTVPGTTAPSVMSVINVNPTNVTVENEIITIMGANLNTVTDVYIGGIKVKIFSQSGNRLQIRAPKGLSGLVDLELKSSLNDVLMTKKLNFGGTAAAGSKKATLVVGGFDHNSRKLTARMKARIDRWLARNSDLGTLTCTGFTSLPRRTTDVTLSTKRGLTACSYSKRQRSDLETSVSQGIEDPRPGSNVRRVRLVLTP
jgi:hypothetical protein